MIGFLGGVCNNAAAEERQVCVTTREDNSLVKGELWEVDDDGIVVLVKRERRPITSPRENNPSYLGTFVCLRWDQVQSVTVVDVSLEES